MDSKAPPVRLKSSTACCEHSFLTPLKAIDVIYLKPIIYSNAFDVIIPLTKRNEWRCKKRPDVQYHVQMLSTQEMITLLHRGEVDYCLSSPSVQGDDIECQIVFIDPILVAVPKGHRLADRSSVSLTELKDEWFVGVKRGYGTRDLVDAVCKSAGYALKYVYEGDEPARLISLVKAEIGIAFIPGTAADSHDDIKFLQVKEHDLVREIALLWHRGRYISRAALEFREVVIEYFKSISSDVGDK
jgi:DNA-binding transcriptional LysR family regulator